MPKFYVESGEVKLVMTAVDSLHAAIKAFEHSDSTGKLFGSHFWIDQRGFRGPTTAKPAEHSISQTTIVHTIDTWDDLDDMFADMDEPDYDDLDDDPDFNLDYP